MPRSAPCKQCPTPIRVRDSKSGLCRVCFKAQKDALKPVTLPDVADGVSETATTREVSKVVHEHVRTLEDMIRVCEIDTEQWDIDRWVCNKWDVGMKPETEKGAPLIPVVTELFQVKVWLKRKSGHILTMQALRAALVEDIRASLQVAPIILPSGRDHFVEGQWLFEFAPFDLHMGKYAWDDEAVTNYDSDIAADLFNASLDFLLARALRLTGGELDRILCVFGNDVSHTDSKRAQTTAGTPMDVDTRYIKVYRRICEIHRRAIDILRQVAPVDVKIVAGNHDELTSFHLGEILATRYENDSRVTVDNSPRLRKYYDYGVNLFGFTHGDAERVNELPLTMAREKPELWAKCSSREWHIGHKHISEKMELRNPSSMVQDFFSDKGVRIRRLTSLSGHDAWHTKHAYMDRRACEAFVFHKTAGFTDHLSFNVDHFTGKALTT